MCFTRKRKDNSFYFLFFTKIKEKVFNLNVNLNKDYVFKTSIHSSKI